MSDNIKAIPTARVSAMEGIRAAISDFIRGVQRQTDQDDTGEKAIDVVSLSPEAQGVPPSGAKLSSARRDLEMSRYRAAANGARAVDARVAPGAQDVRQAQQAKG